MPHIVVHVHVVQRPVRIRELRAAAQPDGLRHGLEVHVGGAEWKQWELHCDQLPDEPAVLCAERRGPVRERAELPVHVDREPGLGDRQYQRKMHADGFDVAAALLQLHIAGSKRMPDVVLHMVEQAVREPFVLHGERECECECVREVELPVGVDHVDMR